MNPRRSEILGIIISLLIGLQAVGGPVATGQ